MKLALTTSEIQRDPHGTQTHLCTRKYRAKAVLLVLALSLIKNNIRLGQRSIQRCNLLNVTWLHCLAVPTNL